MIATNERQLTMLSIRYLGQVAELFARHVGVHQFFQGGRNQVVGAIAPGGNAVDLVAGGIGGRF